MEQKGQGNIQAVAIGALVFILVLAIYGSIAGSMNFNIFGVAVVNLIGLIPLVLVGTVLIAILVNAFR